MNDQEREVLKKYAIWQKFISAEEEDQAPVLNCLSCATCSVAGCGGCGSCGGCSGL